MRVLNLKQNQSLPPEEFDASGCFETCRVKEGEVLHLDEHLHRLEASLRTLGIRGDNFGTIPPIEKLRRSLQEAAKEVGDGYVRIAVRRWGEPRVLIHSHRGIPYTKDLLLRGISVTTVPTRQFSPEAIPAQAKHSERLASILARAESLADCSFHMGKEDPKKGSGTFYGRKSSREPAEVLRVGIHGYPTEATTSNVFLVRGGVLTTPPLWLGVLEGVTRGKVLEVARELKIAVAEIPITRHDLFNAEEAFLTNVLMGILPIREVDGRRIGTKIPGPITQRLIQTLSIQT